MRQAKRHKSKANRRVGQSICRDYEDGIEPAGAETEEVME